MSVLSGADLMRVRTGHGPNDWTDSVPASTGSSRLGGELVVGAPGPWEQGRINARAERARLTTLRGEKLPTKSSSIGRPRLSPDVKLIGRGFPGYATDAERLAARRKCWRESKARKRAEAVA